jgi:apolipoprotein N-acyltransferase
VAPAWAWRWIGPNPGDWRSLGFPVAAAIFWGALTRLGYPPFDSILTGLIGFTGFLWFFGKLRRYMDARNGFWFGFLYGFVFHYAVSSWLNNLYIFNYLAPLGIPFVAALQAFWVGLFGAGMGWVARRRTRHFVLFAALWWTLMEIGRSTGTLAFAFFLLGHLGANHPQHLFRLDVFVYSFLIAGGCAAVASALNRWWAIAEFEGPKFAWAWVAQVAVLMAVLGGAVWTSRGLDDMLGPDSPTLRFAAVQPNITQTRKMAAFKQDEPTEKWAIFRETLGLALERVKPGSVDVAFFPEDTFAGHRLPMFVNPELAYPAMSLAAQLQAGVLLSDAHFRGPFEKPDFYNSCWLILPDDQEFPQSRLYEKRQLVPFGEHMPFIGWIPYMEDIFDIGIWTAAKNVAVLRLNDDIHLGPMICFETSMPGLAWDSVHAGANVLVAPTNDAWFGRTSGLEHHFVHTIFRAFETGTPVIQAANTGVTGYVDPHRREVVRIEKLQPGVLFGEVTAPTIAKAQSLKKLSPSPAGWLGLCAVYWAAMLALYARDRARDRRRAETKNRTSAA